MDLFLRFPGQVVTIEMSSNPPATYVLDGTLLTVTEGLTTYNLDVSDSTSQNPIAINTKGESFLFSTIIIYGVVYMSHSMVCVSVCVCESYYFFHLFQTVSGYFSAVNIIPIENKNFAYLRIGGVSRYDFCISIRVVNDVYRNVSSENCFIDLTFTLLSSFTLLVLSGLLQQNLLSSSRLMIHRTREQS